MTFNRRHPLPWPMPDRDNWIWLEPDTAWHDGEPKPYKLAFGTHNRYSAAFSEAELRLLRDRIDAVLDAPYRVLVPNPGDDQHVADTIRERLDMLHGHHPRMQVAVLDVDSIGSAPETWAMDARVEMLVYQTAEEMFADGGSRVLIVAGPDALNLTKQAFEAHLCYDLIRVNREVPA